MFNLASRKQIPTAPSRWPSLPGLLVGCTRPEENYSRWHRGIETHPTAAARNRFVPRTPCGSKGKNCSKINAGATTIKRIGGSTREHVLSTTGGNEADQRWRQLKPSQSSNGVSRALHRKQASREHLVNGSQSPRARDRRGVPLLLRVRDEGGREGATEGASAPSFPSTITDVDVVRFSPDGEVLAASSGSFIHLYREWGHIKVARTVAGRDYGGSSHQGSGAYAATRCARGTAAK